ncbi:phage major capsid protein [Microbacterium sp. C7(2022)]|uniref:phage major capsid protein n=1 Tax=Microbacterium sp. C7(2022) TaxID=2992759 RepID=UPI00237A31F5|nr:phage major capsid protein [Microbacterium sp. C7(2022)]MDE0545445.1 phage major capsid protein [Microbacterium sp. C7(2022)]
MSTLNILRGEESGPLLIEPLSNASVAMRVSQVIATDQERYRIPKIVSDPTTAWIGESEDIPESDLAAENVSTTPAKVAGIVFIPNELAEDTTPAAAEIIGRRLVQGVVPKVDAAFFGIAPDEEDPDYEAHRPAGLESINVASLSHVDAAPTSIDPFIDGLAAAEAEGAELTSWVMHPDTAKTLAKLKAGTGSNVPLLGTVEAGTRRVIQGVPISTSPHVTPGTVWGIPEDRSIIVVRKDVELMASQHWGFKKDQLAVRVVARIGFLFPAARSLVKISQAA